MIRSRRKFHRCLQLFLALICQYTPAAYSSTPGTIMGLGSSKWLKSSWSWCFGFKAIYYHQHSLPQTAESLFQCWYCWKVLHPNFALSSLGWNFKSIPDLSPFIGRFQTSPRCFWWKKTHSTEIWFEREGFWCCLKWKIRCVRSCRWLKTSSMISSWKLQSCPRVWCHQRSRQGSNFYRPRICRPLGTPNASLETLWCLSKVDFEWLAKRVLSMFMRLSILKDRMPSLEYFWSRTTALQFGHPKTGDVLGCKCFA